MNYFLIFAVAAAVTLLITPTIRYFAIRFSIMDRKDTRKVHNKVVTRFGGLSIYIGFVFAMSLAFIMNPILAKENLSSFLLVILISTLILILGIYDDAKGADAKVKLAVQILAALLLIQAGFVVRLISNPFGRPIVLGLWSIPVTILWLVGVTNAVNLIDGLDGLATGIVFIACIGLFLIFFITNNIMSAFFAMALAGSCLGFLRYNFPPAKVFMGDTGSMFIGFSIASLAILTSHKAVTTVGLLVPAIIGLGVPILDTSLAFFRRLIFKKVSPFQADKEHIHHVLLNLKLSERKVVFSLWAITAFLNALAIIIYFRK